jgi:hypothetical protein
VDFSLFYSLSDDKSKVKAEGEAKAALNENYLTLSVDFGEPMLFSYVDITGILDNDYTVDITLTSNEKLTLKRLGYQYEDFLFQLFRLRNQLLLKYLLMEELLLQAGFEGQYSSISSDGQMKTGQCEIRLYDTGLVLLPQKADPIRIPYCYISQISKGDYKLSVIDELANKIEISQLGANFDPLSKALSEAFNKMITRTQENVKELIPEADPATVRKLASLMKDGRAAKRKDIELLSSEFWRRLTKKIDEANLKTEYVFLDSLAIKDQECVGQKRGLMGTLTGSYTWLLFPLRVPNSNRLSNAVAMEAFNNLKDQENQTQQVTTENEETLEDKQQSENNTTATTGATYIFQIMENKEYSQAKDEELIGKLEDFIKSINRAMIDINFRREPIYLSDDQLDSTKYVQYRFAIQNIPTLRLLRSLFISRVIHSSPEQWKSDISSLLANTTKSLGDKEK